MSGFKEIELTFNPDGTVEIDQIGWEGQACDGAIEDLINKLGVEKEVRKKPEHFVAQREYLREGE